MNIITEKMLAETLVKRILGELYAEYANDKEAHEDCQTFDDWMYHDDKLAGTVWSVKGVELTVKDVYVDRWEGGYCVNLADGSWGRVATLLERGKQVN